MTTAPLPADDRPLLRTLAPALRSLGRRLHGWTEGPHTRPLGAISRATLDGLARDFDRSADALDVDRPMLVVMLMGGTGVGKSTLLNALAGGQIAPASFQRPTTRDPVVYVHRSVKPDHLESSLRQCRIIEHDRPALDSKVLVDTPDLDSNDLSNRDKLVALLPVADVVLYVGSQEKYHDRLGWELFLEQRRRRAFAFVLNKWDRCHHTGAQGLRPDEDLLRDLKQQGFTHPLLFRTCAQHWVDHPDGQGPPLPEGEQFRDLVRWLEDGLTRLEIEAIKARGVGQALDHLDAALAEAAPPDLADAAARTQKAWQDEYAEEASAAADVILNTLEPYQRDIEHHFTVEGQRRFRGLMAVYLGVFTKVRHAGSTLRDRLPLPIPRLPNLGPGEATAPSGWDLASFTRSCSDLAFSRHLDSRTRALTNRLLLQAEAQGFPVALLHDPVEAVARQDSRDRHARALVEVLHEVEQQWSRPTGSRRLLQIALVWLSDWLPPLALLGSLVLLLWRYFDPLSRGYQVQLSDALLPLIITLVVLVLLHVLIALLLPFRWPALRGEFRRRLAQRLQADLAAVYDPVPAEVARRLQEERRQAEEIRAEAREVAEWLGRREQAASIAALYGD